MTSLAFPLSSAGTAYLQVTATGEWDKATRLGGRNDAECFLSSFPDPPSALGMELLWPGRPISFVGIRLDGDDVARLPSLASVLTTAGCDPETALGAMAPGGLGSIQVAQCGAINAWNQVTPMTLWDGSTWRDPASILGEHPQLQTCAHPVGLEVGHRSAWYATEVSQPTGGLHLTDEALLVELAAKVRERI